MGGTYRDLVVWQKAMDMVVDVYRLTRRFPKEELYGLTAQMRRAAVSVPSNIAEGKGRSSDKEVCLFLSHARGSLLELETQAILARRLGYLPEKDADRLLLDAGETGRILNGLIASLRPGIA